VDISLSSGLAEIQGTRLPTVASPGGTAGEAHERLAVEREGDGQNLTLLAARRVGRRPIDTVDSAVRE
jgi:hypothetical protein